jgi:hypothetical protein
LVGELKGDEGRWEELVLHELDQELMKGREEGLRVKGFKERCLTTVFGDVRIRRRVYMDEAWRGQDGAQDGAADLLEGEGATAGVGQLPAPARGAQR